MKTIKALNLDKIGITASTACAIHCALLPFVLTLLPFWGLEFLAHPAIEISMILLSLMIGAWSLGKSYRKVHQRILPIIILVLGFALIFIGHFSGIEILEPIFIPVGGLAIAGAHFWNIRLSKSCSH